MKLPKESEMVALPAGVDAQERWRWSAASGGRRSGVTVWGPSGVPRAAGSVDCGHLPVEIAVIRDHGRYRVAVEALRGGRRERPAVAEAAAVVRDLATAVTTGFRCRMRLVGRRRAPVVVHIPEPPTSLEIRNFMGQRHKVRKINLLKGVTIARSEDEKDELILHGDDIQLVSRSALLIHEESRQNLGVKDSRYLLNGIYISEKGRTTPAEQRDI